VRESAERERVIHFILKSNEHREREKELERVNERTGKKGKTQLQKRLLITVAESQDISR